MVVAWLVVLCYHYVHPHTHRLRCPGPTSQLSSSSPPILLLILLLLPSQLVFVLLLNPFQLVRHDGPYAPHIVIIVMHKLFFLLHFRLMLLPALGGHGGHGLGFNELPQDAHLSFYSLMFCKNAIEGADFVNMGGK